jgi:tRNA threonylcarbamoyladenosine biosynthesis protein TsaE
MLIISNSVEETRSVGARLARYLQPGDVFALEGDLGAGKTEFVRGLVNSLGEDDVTVRSPSFSILNIYSTRQFPVYHFDFYRLNDSSELGEIGFDEYISGNGICLIEWGTMFPDVMPSDVKVIRFFDEGVSIRKITADFEF